MPMHHVAMLSRGGHPSHAFPTADPSPPTEPRAADDSQFFAALPELSEFAQVTEPRHYSDAPASWHIAISDVRGSTRAIEAGRYRDVNALGVASIVALCNATPNIQLPYIFGGDGATVLVPGSHLATYAAALRGARRAAEEAYSLELRVALVPVAELAADSHPVRVARFRASANVCLAMFAGSGFLEAERRVKDPERCERYLLDREGECQANFEGFECRWQPVQNRRGFVVSLLIQALAASDVDKETSYREVLRVLEQTLADHDACPISVRGLRLKPLSSDYATEARLRAGGASGPSFEAARKNARKKALIGSVLIGVGASAGGFDGKRYPVELVENTDFRKFDETLRMVLDLSETEIAALEYYLESERAAGRLVYGLHRAPSALITCFVRSYAGNHVHFVDGANGGYALAAKQLKAQLARNSDSQRPSRRPH
jgi:hypothetical protein